MECAEWEARIVVWLDGACSIGESERVEAHLARCPACREAAEEYRALGLALMERRAKIPRAERTVAGVMARIGRRRATLLDRLVSAPALAAFILVAAAAALFIYRGSLPGVFTLDSDLGGVLARSTGRMTGVLASLGGGELVPMAIIYGGVTLVILFALGAIVHRALREGCVLCR